MKIEPCPFCGSKAEIDCDSSCDISWSIDNAQVVCTSCDASSAVFWSDKLSKVSCEKVVSEAITAWNKRT